MLHRISCRHFFYVNCEAFTETFTESHSKKVSRELSARYLAIDGRLLREFLRSFLYVNCGRS